MTNIRFVHRDTLACEPFLRALPNGDLIIISQCKDSWEPAPGNRVLIFRSKDGGVTWSDGADICPDVKKAAYCTEVFVDGDKIKAFLTIHNGKFLDFEHCVYVSDDYGCSFYREDAFDLGGFTFYRGAFWAKSGALVQAFQNYPITKDEADRLLKNDEYIWQARIPFVQNGVIIYSSGGVKVSQTVDIPMVIDGARAWKWTEPTVVELEKDHFAMLLRVQNTGFLWRSDSFDGGLTWTEAYKTDIPNPGNKPKLLKDNDAVILLNTPNSGNKFIDRRPLSVWASYDNMQTWAYKKDVVDYVGWLSYPDGIVCDDGKRVMFAFELNRHDLYLVEHIIE